MRVIYAPVRNTGDYTNFETISLFRLEVFDVVEVAFAGVVPDGLEPHADFDVVEWDFLDHVRVLSVDAVDPSRVFAERFCLVLAGEDEGAAAVGDGAGVECFNRRGDSSACCVVANIISR
jgi:hypothetical protein